MAWNPLLSELMVHDRRRALLARSAQERRAREAERSPRRPGRVRRELGHALMRLGARLAGQSPIVGPSPAP